MTGGLLLQRLEASSHDRLGAPRRHRPAAQASPEARPHVASEALAAMRINDEARERIPSDYAGAMITDRGTGHDAAGLGRVERQECLAHVLRSVSAASEGKLGKARRFAAKLKGRLERALALWHERRAGPAVADYRGRVDLLVRKVTRHLRDRALIDAENQRLLTRLGRRRDAGSLLRFLENPSIEPTTEPSRAGVATGGDCSEGVAVRRGSKRDEGVRGVDERAGDPVADHLGTRPARRHRRPGAAVIRPQTHMSRPSGR